MTTFTAAVTAAQASPAQSHVWPVLLVLTLTLAVALAGLYRLRPFQRVPYQLMIGIVVLVVAAFGVVFPVLMPARDHLDALAKAGGENILAFILLTASVGTATLVWFAAQFIRAIGTLLFRAASRGRRRSASAEVAPGGAATTLAALKVAAAAEDPRRGARP